MPLRSPGWRNPVGAMLLVLGQLSCSGSETSATPIDQTTRQQSSGPYGIGRTATVAEVASWDIDVMADGAGLPPGSGTVLRGAEVYAARCAVCHGATGVEGPNNILVGREPNDNFPFALDPRRPLTIGSYWPYATTIFDYINRAMPFDSPGSLPADDVYALVAFLLHRNQIVSEEAVMNAETLPLVLMPARGRFVPDDRTGGRVIK